MVSNMTAGLRALARGILASSVFGRLHGVHAILSERNQQLVQAINNMPQGMCMFDAEQRIIVCNDKYASLYGLTPEMVVPGTRRRDMIERIVSNGIRFEGEASDSYLKERTEDVDRTVDKIHQLADGRTIAVARRPLSGGGWVATHEDITELKQREASFQLLFDNNPVPMCVYDRKALRFMAVNQAAVAHYGYEQDFFLEMSLADLQIKPVAAPDPKYVSRPSSDSIERMEWHRKADGTSIEVAIYARDMKYDGVEASLVSIIDMTERRIAERRIAHLAHHDTLTGLPNRSAFTKELAFLIDNADFGQQFAVLFIDLDHFKEVNDCFGHIIGDEFLCAVTQRIASVVEGQFLARIGGDEFVVIAEGEQPATASTLSNRLLEISSEQLEIHGHRIEIGLSIGVALYPDNGTDAKTLLGNADAVLYRAKAEGRGEVRFFESERDEKRLDRHALLHDLRLALERNELVVYYQPQADKTGAIIGFEALIRWHHSQRGMISPGDFIPLAEEFGLIDEIGEWVLREACRDAASWSRPLMIAVNLSPIQFRKNDLPRIVHSILLETGLSPARLELEVTESVLLGDASRSLSVLRRLKALGVRIAMDDFGTGYSSLSYLQSFPFDKIKIDAQFVSKLGSSPQALSIVHTIVALGHSLNMSLTAEGVETAEQWAFLVEEDVNEFQGYFIGKPREICEYRNVVMAVSAVA